jgi:transcriptional regulator with XRE-family HTH domain
MLYHEHMTVTGRSIPTDGAAIKRARLRAGYGVIQFATKVGITYGHLSRIESGRSNASPDLVRTMADALGRKIDDFLSAEFRAAA